MANILLFGVTSGITDIPTSIVKWLEEYNVQGHKFILGNKKGADTAFHRALSRIGAVENSTLYVMNTSQLINNTYNIKTKTFYPKYNADEKSVRICDIDGETLLKVEGVQKEEDIGITREVYEFKDRQLINDCDIAIGIYDGQNKTVMKIIQLVNIMDKPCYLFDVYGGKYGS